MSDAASHTGVTTTTVVVVASVAAVAAVATGVYLYSRRKKIEPAVRMMNASRQLCKELTAEEQIQMANALDEQIKDARARKAELLRVAAAHAEAEQKIADAEHRKLVEKLVKEKTAPAAA